MAKYLNFFEFESGYTEAVGAGELFYPNVSYTENDDTVHWNTGPHRISASVNDDSLGNVSVQETAFKGEDVVFLVNVFDGPRQCQVSVADGNGNNVQVTDEGDNNYTFTMPASDVTISVVIGEKPKHTVTVNSTDDMVTDVNFMSSEDGEPSYREGDWVDFNFNFDDPDGTFQVGSAQASDCDGNSIEVNLEDLGEGFYSCSFEMPGCDANVFITVELKPKYNISASVNDSSLGAYDGPDSAPEGGQVEFDVDVFVIKSDAIQISSVTVTDGNGDEVECTDDGDEYYHHYTFTMPGCDVSVFITIEDTRPRYNISWSVNDDSLGQIDLHQDIAHEGESVTFDVKLFDSEQYHVSSVTITDGNGNEIKPLWDFDEGDHSRYHFNDMPASDVSIFATIEPKQ